MPEQNSTTPTPTTTPNFAYRRADFSTLIEALDYAADSTAGYNFYSARGELTSTLPYGQMREHAVAMARSLIQADVAGRSTVVLLGETDPEIITSFFACQYAGLIPALAPVPTSLGGREAYVDSLRRLLISARAVVAIAPESYLDFLQEAVAGLDQAPRIGTPAAFADRPHPKTRLRPFGPDDPCYLQYSSGSTRWPLGVDVSQQNLMANAHAIAVTGLDISPGDRGNSWLPLYHDMGLVGFLLLPLMVQMTSDFMAPRDFARRPLSWLQLFGENGATLAYSPTFGYELCLKRATKARDLNLDLSTWRAAGIGGDMIQPQIMEWFSDAFEPHGFKRSSFLASYGMAEATLAVSFATPNKGLKIDLIDRQRLENEHIAIGTNASDDDIPKRGLVVCGTALPGHVIEIRDQDGAVLADRHVGRIFVKGPSIAKGYLGKPDASANVFKDGWLDTGDLGYLIAGELVIAGRSKDLMIINGRNVWPQDIEWSVETLPGLRRGDAAVFSVEDDTQPARVVVLIQCRQSEGAAREELRREAKAVVKRSAAIDGEILLLPPHSLPMTSSGKLSRTRAKQNYLNGHYSDGSDEGVLARAASD